MTEACIYLMHHHVQDIVRLARVICNKQRLEEEIEQIRKKTMSQRYGYPGDKHEAFIENMVGVAQRVVRCKKITELPDEIASRDKDEMCKGCPSFSTPPENCVTDGFSV